MGAPPGILAEASMLFAVDVNEPHDISAISCSDIDARKFKAIKSYALFATSAGHALSARQHDQAGSSLFCTSIFAKIKQLKGLIVGCPRNALSVALG
jgi:hypothetical protein